MANTKVTKAVLADDAVGLDQLEISNDPSNGQVLSYSDTALLTWTDMSGGVAGISSSADATAITIDSSENVGIGTTSPARSPLHLATSGTDYCQLHMTNGTSGSTSSDGLTLFTNGTDTGLMQRENSYLLFGTNDTERMRIDSSGRVLIGWTSSLSSTAQLQVNSNAKIGNLFFQGNSTNSIISAGNGQFKVSSLEIRGGGSGLDFDVTLIKTGVGFTNMFKVDSPSGDTFTNDGTISSLSDERIKTDINDLADGLDIVKQLRPVTFKYNDTTEDEEGKKELGTADDVVRYGFIAQEVEEVAPHYVETSTRKINNVEVDDFKSMSTTRMIPMLFKAIQELSDKNDALEARIETLESN